MKTVFKVVQRELKRLGHYHGKIDGVIGPKSESALNKVYYICNTGYRRDRLAVAFLQTILNGPKAKTQLLVDGLFGPKTTLAFSAYAKSNNLSQPALKNTGANNKNILSGVTFDPFHNLAKRPTFTPTGVVLHRTAGYFNTGDYKVGKWGHASGPGRKRSSVSFHFLIGKEPGEIIQFVPINTMVHHVRSQSKYYLGIELSGDVGRYSDGSIHGEDLTHWQLESLDNVLHFISSIYPKIPMVRCPYHKELWQVGRFHGLVSHRDLIGNDHADSPNNADWERILKKLERNS